MIGAVAGALLLLLLCLLCWCIWGFLRGRRRQDDDKSSFTVRSAAADTGSVPFTRECAPGAQREGWGWIHKLFSSGEKLKNFFLTTQCLTFAFYTQTQQVGYQDGEKQPMSVGNPTTWSTHAQHEAAAPTIFMPYFVPQQQPQQQQQRPIIVDAVQPAQQFSSRYPGGVTVAQPSLPALPQSPATAAPTQQYQVQEAVTNFLEF